MPLLPIVFRETTWTRRGAMREPGGGNESAVNALRYRQRNLEMTAFIERVVQKFTEAAPIETAVSSIVAGVLENTATRLSRGEVVEAREDQPAEEAA
jgi:hypothetical protein